MDILGSSSEVLSSPDPLSDPDELEDLLVFTIKADRFLRNMVRAVVGTLLDVGEGKIKPEDIIEIIAKKDRSEAGFSAPAHALFLTNIEYPKTYNLQK